LESAHLRTVPPKGCMVIPCFLVYPGASFFGSAVDLKTTPPIPVTFAMNSAPLSLGPLRLKKTRDHDTRVPVAADLQTTHALKVDPHPARNVSAQRVIHRPPIAHGRRRVGWVHTVRRLKLKRDEIGDDDLALLLIGNVEPKVGALPPRNAGKGGHRFDDEVLAGRNVVSLGIAGQRAHHGITRREVTGQRNRYCWHGLRSSST